jgi:hypothetical protein
VWEEGRHPGRLVARAAVVVLVLTTALSLLIGNHLGTTFDVVFVLVCAGSAMWVAPRDFFIVGVMPPLLLAGTVAVLAWFDRGAVAKPGDAIVQAFVSGLAHHAKALVIGYALTLVLLALRQVALHRRGALRRPRTLVTAPEVSDAGPVAEAPAIPGQAGAPEHSMEISLEGPDDLGRPSTGTTAGAPH